MRQLSKERFARQGGLKAKDGTELALDMAWNHLSQEEKAAALIGLARTQQ
jgi:hypothetical protein